VKLQRAIAPSPSNDFSGVMWTGIARAQAMPNKRNFASPTNASEKFCFVDVLWPTIGAADTVAANCVD